MTLVCDKVLGEGRFLDHGVEYMYMYSTKHTKEPQEKNIIENT